MDVMLDLETLSTQPNAVITAIGAVVFDPNGNDTVESVTQANRGLYRVVDIEGQHTTYHRHLDARTIYWWLEQSDYARSALTTGPRVPLKEALASYVRFLQEWKVENVWGFGATFDNVIIETAIKDAGLFNPVSYRGQRCMRTIAAMTTVKVPRPDALVNHNALHDAQYQVLSLQAMLRELRERRSDGGVHEVLDVSGQRASVAA